MEPTSILKPSAMSFSFLAAQRASLVAGLVFTGALWMGPLPELARRSFSQHTILHLCVMVIAAPLVAYGLTQSGMRIKKCAGPLMIAASIVELAAVWGWHIPAAHEAAVTSPILFSLQQLSFLAAGVGLWLVSFGDDTPGGAAIGALALMFTFVHMAMLGVLLALAPKLLYAPEICTGGFGLDRLEDQRLAGALMATLGSLPYLIGSIVLGYRVISYDNAHRIVAK